MDEHQSSEEFEYLSQHMRMRKLCYLKDVSVDYIEILPGAVKRPTVHYECDEILYVLEGTLELSVDGQAITCRAGDCIGIPRATAHGSMNLSSQIVRMLAINSPPYEQAFEHVPASDPESAT